MNGQPVKAEATVTALFVAPAKAEPMMSVDVVHAVAQRGLVGDRYYLGAGFYSHQAGWGANVTLIESEAIAAVNVGYGGKSKNISSA
jgi:hypothetical protein